MCGEVRWETVWEHGVSGGSGCVTGLRGRTLNSRRLNTFSDLSPMLSYGRKAGIPATFSPSSSLTSRGSLVLKELPGPSTGGNAAPASSQAAVKINGICREGPRLLGWGPVDAAAVA